MKITIYSQFNSKTGLAEVAEGIGLSLHQMGHDVCFHSLGSWPEHDDPLVRALIAKPRHETLDSIGFFCWFPEDIVHIKRHKKLVLAAFVESTKARPAIVHGCNKADSVLTFSGFCKDVLISSGVTSPIVVRNPGVKSLYQKPLRRDRKSTTFLCLGVAQDRKNMAAVELVFRECFKPQFFPDVKLILKSNHCGDLDWVAKMANISTIWTGKEGTSADLTDAEMLGLYHGVDCMLMPSKGEGIGMPALEAAATGLPVIYTDFSSPAEYFDSSTGYPVPFEMEKAFPSRYPFSNQDNGQWAVINLAALATAMSQVVSNKEEALTKGARASVRIANFSWADSAEVISSF